MSSLSIAVLQYAISNSPDENVAYIARALSDTTNALVILPEMFLGRWNRDAADPQIAATETRSALERLVPLTAKNRLCLLGSALEWDAGKTYNTVWRVDGGGATPVYRKIHRFTPLGEHERYAGGTATTVMDIMGTRIGAIVCYDLRFADVFSAMRVRDARVVVVPARWPAARIAHWRAFLVSRAIEYQCYVVGVNCLGKDEFGMTAVDYPGQSLVVDPWGQVLLDAQGTAGVHRCTVDLARVDEVRKKLPVWEDRVRIES